MRWLVTAAFVAVTGLSLTGCGGSRTSGSRLPPRVQDAIKRSHPSFAYAPTVLPSGYHYQVWTNTNTGYDIYFGPNPQLADLGFHVTQESCPSVTPMATYRSNGVEVIWGGTYEDQQAWRCLGPNLVMSATRSVAGDSPIQTARQKRDALYLVRLVAYARQISG
jgi:hypothetical protein